jgi:hypothetical protein
MFDLIHGLGNILCVLAILGVPIAMIKPSLIKQDNRFLALRALGGLFLIGFMLVAVGAYYGGMLQPTPIPQ